MAPAAAGFADLTSITLPARNRCGSCAARAAEVEAAAPVVTETITEPVAEKAAARARRSDEGGDRPGHGRCGCVPAPEAGPLQPLRPRHQLPRRHPRSVWAWPVEPNDRAPRRRPRLPLLKPQRPPRNRHRRRPPSDRVWRPAPSVLVKKSASAAAAPTAAAPAAALAAAAEPAAPASPRRPSSDSAWPAAPSDPAPRRLHCCCGARTGRRSCPGG